MRTRIQAAGTIVSAIGAPHTDQLSAYTQENPNIISLALQAVENGHETEGRSHRTTKEELQELTAGIDE